MFITPQTAEAAARQHGTVFFTVDLQPVKPEPGKWFCELELVIPEEGDNYLMEGSLVEYVGPDESVAWDGTGFAAWGSPMLRHLVATGGGDARRPHGEILILQA